MGPAGALQKPCSGPLGALKEPGGSCGGAVHEPSGRPAGALGGPVGGSPVGALEELSMGGRGSCERPVRALWTPQHWQDQPGEFCLWHICAHVTMQFTIGSLLSMVRLSTHPSAT